MILFGFLSWTIGMFAISFANTTLLIYIALLPYMLDGIAGPTIQGLVSNSVSEKEQGNLQGVLTSLGSLSAIIAPLIYSVLFSFYSAESAPVYFPGAPYLLGAVILVLATVVVIFSLKSLNQSPHNQKADGDLVNQLDHETII